MSQVIVTQDQLTDKRRRSGQEEHRIETNAQFAKWRRSDVTGFDPVRRAVGLAVMPILGLWGVLALLLTGIMEVLKGVFLFLGRLIGGRRNLLTGKK